MKKLIEQKGGIANNYYKIFPPLGFFWTDDWNDEIIHFFQELKIFGGLTTVYPTLFIFGLINKTNIK